MRKRPAEPTLRIGGLHHLRQGSWPPGGLPARERNNRHRKRAVCVLLRPPVPCITFILRDLSALHATRTNRKRPERHIVGPITAYSSWVAFTCIGNTAAISRALNQQGIGSKGLPRSPMLPRPQSRQLGGPCLSTAAFSAAPDLIHRSGTRTQAFARSYPPFPNDPPTYQPPQRQSTHPQSFHPPGPPICMPIGPAPTRLAHPLAPNIRSARPFPDQSRATPTHRSIPLAPPSTTPLAQMRTFPPQMTTPLLRGTPFTPADDHTVSLGVSISPLQMTTLYHWVYPLRPCR